MVAVLEARMQRFFDHCHARSIDDLFARLQDWGETEGSRGCLFLRAQGEAGESTPEVAEVVAGYREKLRSRISQIVNDDLGSTTSIENDDSLATQILVLFEGATSTAPYLGSAAVTSARSAAALLISHARRRR